jgi:hypothetical protein
MKRIASIAALAMFAGAIFGQDITLSKPPAALGVDVLDAIRTRAAARAFVKKDVPASVLSTIVWAGNGLKATPDAVTSASKAGGTFPVSGDVNYVSMFVLNAGGVYRFDPAAGVLKQVNKKDSRADITSENIANNAFYVLYTFDTTKLPSFVKGNAAAGREMAMGTASYGAQNIALVAAAEKLSTIVMFNITPAAVATAAKLSRDEAPLFIMQVGSTQQ